MALLLRSLLEGERRLVSAAFAELSGQPHGRAAAFARDPHGQGFAALALRAGIPAHATPAFRAALHAIDLHGAGQGAGLKPWLVDSVIAACEARRDPKLAPILALLWRFAVEAARAEARAVAREAKCTPRLPQKLDFPPANDEAAARTDPGLARQAA
jgi:hypothetical protein